MGDNQVAAHEAKEVPTNQMRSSTPLPYNNCDEKIQPSLGVDGEGQPLVEQRYTLRNVDHLKNGGRTMYCPNVV